MGAGLAVVLVATLALNLLFWRIAGIRLVSLDKLLILVPVGLVTSWLGGALAVKYFKLG